MTTNDKTATGATPAGTTGSATTKTDITASAKAAARKNTAKQLQEQKNKKANSSQKKKQPQVTKSTFEGIASGVNPMKGIVIALGDGNLAGQFRLFQKKLAGAAADDKAYGLDSSILDLSSKIKSDFVKPKPNPLVHSDLIDVYDEDKKKTGERKLVCHNPILRDQMEAEYSMDLKIQKSNWNQFERHYEGYYRTAIGNIEDTILTYCRADTRMPAIEANKDLVGLLLVLRSVCAQNNGAVKVDEEYQNLNTLHSAVGYRQRKNISDTKFADEVADRYGSTIFTSGRFTFGLSVYEKVLKTYPTSNNVPLTFINYLQLPADDQLPIDAIVRERTVARLIVKNSLNDRLRDHLQTSYSTTEDCYPNTISDALSLLSTFVKAKNDTSLEEAVVSYHEHDMNNHDITESEYVNDNMATNDGDDEDNKDMDKHVKFSATVMAAVITEATTEVEEHQFIGASFEQLQDVDDAYEDNEPDLVVCAHIIDTTQDGNDDNTFPNHHHDFDMILYHTSQRVNNVSDVYTINYDSKRPDMISYQYRCPTPESIIDYSDTMRMKFKLAGIHDSTDLMNIFTDRNNIEAAAAFKQQLNDVDQKGLKVSTIKLLREETIRCLQHVNFNILRYKRMEDEIGDDVEMESFPKASILLHHVVSAVAINQQRRKPNRWVNKVTSKLINCDINTIEQLESKLDSGKLNDIIGAHHLPRLHQVSIHGFQLILGTADFRQGRS